jgi:predicted nucleic acid-binding protein
MGSSVDPQLPLRVIIDTNVFISAENIGVRPDEHSRHAAEFIRLAGQLGVHVLISQGTQSDILQASGSLRHLRQKQLQRYSVLESVPHDMELARKGGFPEPISSNDEADLEVLQALVAGASDWLVTQDLNLQRRATRAGYGDRVLGLKDVIEIFKFYLNKPSEMPGVLTVKGYQFNLSASIFDDVRSDYEGFNDWWQIKVAREHRDVLTLGTPDNPEGISVLKLETDGAHGLPVNSLKICTFKVAEPYSGSRRGEHLLKATVDYARRNRAQAIYVEVLSHKSHLTSWLEGFGFDRIEGATTIRDEYVFAKYMAPHLDDQELLPLEHNVAYGPGSVRVQAPHIVPIKPRYHSRLFPEAEPQLSYFSGEYACGNAIGKAYLSHAAVRRLESGDTLLFMRTGGRSAITIVGVVESTLVSSQAEKLVSFVGNRTVYSAEEIKNLSCGREVLAIRFRLDRIVSPPWYRDKLQAAKVLVRPPQSIQQVREEGLTWIRKQLGE